MGLRPRHSRQADRDQRRRCAREIPRGRRRRRRRQNLINIRKVAALLEAERGEVRQHRRRLRPTGAAATAALALALSARGAAAAAGGGGSGRGSDAAERVNPGVTLLERDGA